MWYWERQRACILFLSLLKCTSFLRAFAGRVLRSRLFSGRIFLRESATDRALLTVAGETENVKMYFIKHPEYEGKPCKEPPRTMGDGFAVLQSANLEFRYNQDILGN